MQKLKWLIRHSVILIGLTLLLANVASAHEGLHEQIAEVSRQIKRAPKDARLYLKRGELYRLHGEWQAALADYNRAEQLDPRLEEARFGRGRMYFEAGKPEQAKIWLDRFLLSHPDHFDALVTRARVLVTLGQQQAAARDYTRVISQMTRPKPELYLERAQALLADDRRREALEGIDEGVKKLGPVVTLQLFAIDLEVANKQYDAALSRLDQITIQSPRKESWLARRGDILLQAGREEEARETFQAALAAMQSLPPHLRATKSTTALEHRLRAALSVR